MQRVLVLGSSSAEVTETTALQAMSEFVDGALKSIQKSNARVSFCHLDELGYLIDNEQAHILDMRNSCDLTAYNLVFFRGKLARLIAAAAVVSEYLSQHNIPHVNTAYGTRRAVGKIPQMYHLASLGLSIPKTVSARSDYLPTLISGQLMYPFVLKDVKGSHGCNNYLVSDESQLHEILKRDADIEFMAQELIPNEGDYRILFVGDQIKIILREGAVDSHLNNTSMGAKASLIDVKTVDPLIIEQSKKFARYCEYEIAGVDVIINSVTGKHYFLEINSQPQLASGAFVDSKRELLGNYFKELLDHSA